MTLAPSTFTDPLVKPVVFSQKIPQPIFAFGESSFPVSFAFNSSPRPAIFLGVAAVQLENILTDKEIHGEIDGVTQFAMGASQTLELYANGENIETADFYIKIPSADGGIVLLPGNAIAEIRQPSFDSDIIHSFKNGTSTLEFEALMYGGDPYYAVATMNIDIYPTLIDSDWSPSAITTLKGATQQVTVVPTGYYGIVDIKISVAIKWYEDANREYEAETVPTTLTIPDFGLRFFISNPGKVAKRVSLLGKACTVNALYPTSVLQSLGGDSVSLVYWGGGEDGNGLFWGREDDIEVSPNGLPLQGGGETASYILSNPLNDYDFSSSSSSSTSSLNSSSSDSTVFNTSSTSTQSTLSLSSWSSQSISSQSSKSFSSSSSESSSSQSSATSISSLSSTELEALSSTSSITEGPGGSSSSSLVASILARYGFGVEPTTTGKVMDDSGNGYELSIGAVSGSLGPPVWGVAYGRSGGGGFRFYADAASTDYLSMSRQPWATTRGTISIWARTLDSGNGDAVLFCISNGTTASKTELAISADATHDHQKVSFWLTVDGVSKWYASGNAGTFSPGVWHNVVLVQNGTEPKAYVDGKEIVLSFAISTSKGAWIAALAAATSPATMVVVGAAPRYYSPYMTLGFSGLLDEIVLWGNALSASDVDDIYHSTEV